jgi:hypothetical protein
MALINCPECDNKISDKAHSCPNCGYVLPAKYEFKPPPRNKTGYIWLLIIATFLSIIIWLYFMFNSSSPEKVFYEFTREKNEREINVKQDLEDIRDCQIVYHNSFGVYCDNLDSLISFIATARVPIIKKIPDPNDKSFSKTINDTIGYVEIKDSLFRRRVHFNLDSMVYIPGTQEKYNLVTKDIVLRGIKTNVLMVSAHYSDILKGLDEDHISTLIRSREDVGLFAGLKIGSLHERSLLGNWK